MHLTVDELLAFTDEARARWEKWFDEHGDGPLMLPVAGAQDTTVGAQILHIFGPELRYVERLRNLRLTAYRGSMAADNAAELFAFGRRSRAAMREYVAAATPEDWARMVDIRLPNLALRATVRKIVLHALLHEFWHWAQIARVLRERGLAPPGENDLLVSAALD